jgi:hypothetical protein
MDVKLSELLNIRLPQLTAKPYELVGAATVADPEKIIQYLTRSVRRTDVERGPRRFASPAGVLRGGGMKIHGGAHGRICNLLRLSIPLFQQKCLRDKNAVYLTIGDGMISWDRTKKKQVSTRFLVCSDDGPRIYHAAGTAIHAVELGEISL